MPACGIYELLVDLKGSVVEAGSGIAALLRVPSESMEGTPVTRFLRGPAMVASPGQTAPVTLKVANADNVAGVAVRRVLGDRISITVLPAPSNDTTATSSETVTPRLVNELVRSSLDPLTGIIGFATLAHIAPTPHRRRYYLDQVAAQAHRCRRLLQALEERHPSTSPAQRTASIGEAVSAAVSVVRTQLEGHGLVVDWDPPSAPLWVSGDKRQLVDVLVAIIERLMSGLQRQYRSRTLELVAPKQRDHQVEVELRFSGQPSSAVLVSRLDVGTGDNDRDLSRAAYDAALAGLNASGGSLTVRSEGDTVVVSLLLNQALAPKRLDDARTPVPLAILAIDADAMVGEMYIELLGVSGHTVSVCRSLHAARDSLRKQHFDLVIADYFLPDGTLGQLWAEHRDQYPILSKRTLVVTGLDHHPELQTWLARSGTDSIAKPFEPRALLNRISRMMP